MIKVWAQRGRPRDARGRRAVVWLLALVAALAGPGWAGAQQNAVRMRVAPGGFGLDGVVRPGSWAGVHLLLDNPGADDRDVVVSWELGDEDGDRVVVQRAATLARQRDNQAVWLYAALPARLKADDRFAARCVDAQSGALLASAAFGPDPDRLAAPDDTLVAVTSGADLGLSDYGRHETAHAAVRLIRGVSFASLPDRWAGLQAVSTLVWTPDGGGDPADPQQVGDATLEAVREWCYRGGHLVVMLPAVNNTWFGSPLADLLPVNAAAARRVDTERWGKPDWMGGLQPDPPEALSQTVFRVGGAASNAAGPAGGPTVLLRDVEGRAVAVAGRFGFGRVTLLGLDLTQAPIRRAGMPWGERRLWSRVLNLTAPVYKQSYVAAREKKGAFLAAAQMQRRELGDFIGGQIALTGTVSALLLGAVVVFGLYWLLAGVVLQPLAKRRGVEHRAWPLFAVVVLVFTAVAWGAAVLVRPGGVSLRHVSVVDVDVNRGVGRVRSFVSVFLPDFGATEAALGQAPVAGLPGAPHNLLASPGLTGDAASPGFIEARSYTVSAANPHAARLPTRATTKRLLLDYVAPTLQTADGLSRPFEIAARTPIIQGPDGWPRGALVHTLPGVLTNVVVVQARGEGFDRRGHRGPLPPRVWRPRNALGQDGWAPGDPLVFAGPVEDHGDLVVPLRTYRKNRDLTAEGYLGHLLDQEKGAGALLAGPGALDESVIARRFMLMGFYDALPPPNFLNRDFPQDAALARGIVGPGADLTPLLQGRRLIVLGQLKSAALPVALTLDGATPEGEGWSFVRAIVDY